MRNLNTVIDQILEIAPELENEFKSLKESVAFAAPEAMTMWWNFAAEILEDKTISHPRVEEIIAIFNDQ